MDRSKPTQQTGWMGLVSKEHLPFSVILAGGVVLHAMNVFVSATILPSVVADIGGKQFYAWATTLFTVCSIISAALSARLVMRLGPRGAYLAAFAVFAIGTAICGSAPNIGILNFGRAVQGAGGGALYALSYIVIRMVFAPQLRALAVGLITVMWGVATLCGPAIGGVFAQFGEWRLAFWALIPIVAVIAVLCVAVLPSQTRKIGKGDALPIGQLAAMASVVVLLSIAGSANRMAEIFGCIVVALLAWSLFIRLEKRATARVFPYGSLSSGNALGRVYLFVALMLLGMQPEIYVPFFAQRLFGQTPLVAGYIGAVMAFGWTLGSVLSAGLTGSQAEATKSRGALISLLGLMIATGALSLQIGGLTALFFLCFGLVCVGFGIGYCWPHVTTSVYELAPEGEEELAASGVTTVQLFATAVGAAIAGLIVNSGLAMWNTSGAAVLLFGSFAVAPLLARIIFRPNS